MSGQIQALLLTVLLLLPWLIIVPWWLQKFNSGNIFFGMTAGIAANVTVAYLLAQWHYTGWFGCWLTIPAIAGGVILCLNRRQISLYCHYLVPGELLLRHSGMITLMIICCFVYGIPVLSSPFPPGWDSTFHCLLAKKILLTGQLSVDWLPFEVIPVNYTQGLHALISAIADNCGAPVHVIFQVLHLPVMLLNTLAIYLLSRKIFNSASVAFFSGMSYCCLCGWGGFFSYYSWGGLPTEFALMSGLAILLLSLGQHSKRTLLTAALCAGGMLLVHHLTAVIFALIFVFYLIGEMIWQREFSRRHRWLIQAGCATLLLYSWFIIPYAMKSMTLGGTSVLRFYEETVILPWQAVNRLGIVLCIAAATGIILTLKKDWQLQPYRLLIFWLAALLFFFAGLDYLYRGMAVWLYHDNFTAFTPSRFLTLLSCPLAIFSGFAINYLLEFIRKRFNTGERLPAILAIIIMLGIAAPEFKTALTRQVIEPQTIRAAELIANGTPPDSLVFIRLQLGLVDLCWIPYLAWRQTVMTPIPASENRQAVFERKIGFFQSNSANPQRIKEWLEQNHLEGYLLFADPTTGQMRLFKQFNKTGK